MVGWIERGLMSGKVIGPGIAILSLLGMLGAFYMLSYQQGRITSMYCPIFGQGCEIAGLAPQAKHFGVPNAAIGILGYMAMIGFAIWPGPKSNGHQRSRALALSTTSFAALASSTFLTWEQMVKVKAWCFWCLLSTAINAIIFPLALIYLEKKE